MVAVSLTMNRLCYPTPYQFGRIAEYVVLALALFFATELLGVESIIVKYTVSTAVLVTYMAYVVRREKIDVKALIKAILRR